VLGLVSRNNLAEVTRLYPGSASDAARKKFLDFVKGEYSPLVRGEAAIDAVQATDDRATANLQASLEWLDDFGSRKQGVAAFSATFERSGGGWRLTAIQLRRPFP
jgi:hypothetical protein